MTATLESWADRTLEGSSGGDSQSLARTLDALLGLKF